MSETLVLKELFMWTGLVWGGLIVIGGLYLILKNRYYGRKKF